MTLPDETTRTEMLASDMERGWRPAINDSNTVVSFGLTESGLMTAMQHEPAVSQPDLNPTYTEVIIPGLSSTLSNDEALPQKSAIFNYQNPEILDGQ